MGFYYMITFENPHYDLKKSIEYFAPTLDAFQSWHDVLEYALEEWKKLFAENKYWVLKEIRDNVRR